MSLQDSAINGRSQVGVGEAQHHARSGMHKPHNIYTRHRLEADIAHGSHGSVSSSGFSLPSIRTVCIARFGFKFTVRTHSSASSSGLTVRTVRFQVHGSHGSVSNSRLKQFIRTVHTVRFVRSVLTDRFQLILAGCSIQWMSPGGS